MGNQLVRLKKNVVQKRATFHRVDTTRQRVDGKDKERREGSRRPEPQHESTLGERRRNGAFALAKSVTQSATHRRCLRRAGRLRSLG